MDTDAVESRRLSYTQGPAATARQADIRYKVCLFNEGVINSRTINKRIEKYQMTRLGYNFPNPIYIIAGI